MKHDDLDRVDARLDAADATIFTLNLDVDAEALWIGLQGKSRRPSLVAQGGYVREALPRVLDILDELRIVATVFFPATVAIDHPTLCPMVHSRGHEIACHGWDHEPLSELSIEEERVRLRRAKATLEEQVQSEVVGFGAPAADVSENTVPLLIEEGFLYDRSFLDSDFPYVFSSGASHLIELPIAWSLDDFAYFGHNVIPRLGWGIRDPREVAEIWRAEFAGFRANGGYACLVLHPEVIGRWARLTPIRSLLAEASSWQPFRTCKDVAMMVRDAR